MKPEARFKQWLKSKLNGHFVPIENNTSVPDVFLNMGGCTCWLELKVAPFDHILMRIGQYAWIKRDAAHDGDSLLVCRDPITGQVALFKGENLEVEKYDGRYVLVKSEPDVVLHPTSTFRDDFFEAVWCFES